MDLIGPLALGTLGFAIAFAYINMRQTEEQLQGSRKEREGTASASGVAAE